MAQKVIRQFIDDIDGSPAERTFTFTVDGTRYEIDLSSENIKEFNDAIAGFVESAREVNSGNGRQTRKVSSSSRLSGSGRSVSRPRPCVSGPGGKATASTTVAGSRRRSNKHSNQAHQDSR